MTALEILDSIPYGTVVKDWYDYIPLGHPEYWELSTTLEVLARLDKGWRHLTSTEWYKVTVAERREIKADDLRLKWHLLWTKPELLDY